MALEDGFNDLKANTKGATNREGDGLAVGYNVNTLNAAPYNTYEVSVKKGGKASDTTQVFSGPGTGTATSVGQPEDSKGFVTDSGNKIAIHGTPGAESIEIIHHSGAALVIDVDGSIFLMPTSKKGFGLHADRGDGVVSAQGRLILKGHSDIVIETEGSVAFNVGQNMFLNVQGDMNVDVGGSYSESIDGSRSSEVVMNSAMTVGGAYRETIVDGKRTQISKGNVRYDVGGGSYDVRSEQDIYLHAQKSIDVNSKEDSTYEVSGGKLTLIASDDTIIASKANMYVTADNNVALDAGGVIAEKSEVGHIVSTKDSMFIDATNLVDVRSTATKLSATGEFNVVSACTNMSSTSTINVNATGAIDIRGSTVDVNKAAASAEAVRAVQTTDARTSPNLTEPNDVEYADANTVIKNMTSLIDAPEFPKNAKKMSDNEMSLYENEGDTPPSAAKAMASMNPAGGSAYSKGTELGSIGDSGNVGYDGSNNKTKAEESPIPCPTSCTNTSTKLSRNLSVGGFPGLGQLPTNQMGYSQKEILENVRHLAYNIIDPILMKFGSSVTLLHGIRLGQGGSRHYIGKAIDIRASSRDHGETAMIAKWIVENLPYDRCFLEANRQGTIHIHVEAAPAGSSGARTVWTCADPQCRSATSGLQLSFAQQGLKKMGFLA